MITLSNGDRWIVDDSEWIDLDIPYGDACACRIPETTIKEFVEKIEESLNNDDVYLPRKWTAEYGGYWDCNLDIEEVFKDVAVRTIPNKWSTVFIMPWGAVYVVYTTTDSGGYDACAGIVSFTDLGEYKKAVL